MCEVLKDTKIDIISDFLNNDNKKVVNSNFQQSKYAKNLKMLSRGILPKEYRNTKHRYSRDEHMDYVEKQVEYLKTTKIQRGIKYGD